MSLLYAFVGVERWNVLLYDILAEGLCEYVKVVDLCNIDGFGLWSAILIVMSLRSWCTCLQKFWSAIPVSKNDKELKFTSVHNG